MSWGQAGALVGAVLLVGAVVIATIVLTRPARDSDAQPQQVAMSPAPTVADPGEPARQQREKQRPEFIRLMIAAGTALSAQRYENAVEAYSAALKLFPEDADAQRGLTEARAGLEARSRQARDEENRRAGFARFMDQGKEAMTAKQYAAAVRAFQQAIQLQPADQTAADSLREAQTALSGDEAQKQKQAEYQTHMDAGQAAAVAGRYADALREYVAALRIMPNDAAALQGQRLAERQLDLMQDQKQRKADFARLLDQAGAALRNRRYQEAIDAYTAALKLFRDDETAKRGLAEAQQGLNLQAVEVARQLALGDAAMRSGRYVDAVRAYREAARLAPGNALAAQGLLNAQAALDSLRTNQGAYWQLINRGAAAMAAQRYADAIQAYTSALQLVPNDPVALQGLRDARAALGLPLVLVDDFARALERGLADLEQQHFREAIRHLKRALELQPDSVPAARALRQARYGEAMADGRSAMKDHRYAEAVRSFEKALVQVPDDPAATQALAKARRLVQAGK
jgi:tetratricopeptide (TPR) repeat protein